MLVKHFSIKPIIKLVKVPFGPLFLAENLIDVAKSSMELKLWRAVNTDQTME